LTKTKQKMYFDLIVVILVVFFLFLVSQEYFRYVPDPNYTVPVDISPFQNHKKPKYNVLKKPDTYKSQYKKLNELNRETRFSSVFYENSICRDLVNYENEDNALFTITKELSCKEMKTYLDSIKSLLNFNIEKSDKALYDILNTITVNKWKSKILVSSSKYDELTLKLNNDELKKYVNGSENLKFIDITINHILNTINNQFETSSLFKKYNNYHPFESYKMINYKINAFYMYEGESATRALISFKIHRPNKINDFIILVDVFFIKKSNTNEIKTTFDNFLELYHIYIKHFQVLGNPLPHNSKYLEEDDTNFILNQNEFQIITRDIFDLLNSIDKIELDRKENPIELAYKKLFEHIQEIDQNKTFNSIVFKQILFKMKKIDDLAQENANMRDTELVFIYEDLVVKFINNCKEILTNKNINKRDLDRDIKFNNSDLTGQLIITEEIEKLIENINARKIKRLNFNELIGERLRERASKYRCYNPKYEDVTIDNLTTRPACISYHKDIGLHGVWDKQCESNDECPFFQANKNYPNDFGGCLEGKCEMPIGMSVVGGTKVSKIGSPYCYNCNKVTKTGATFQEQGRCCSDQLKNKSFKSPDFMFERDKQVRFKHRNYLDDNSLKP